VSVVDAQREGRFQIVLRVRAERDVRLGRDDARNLVEVFGHEVRDVVVVTHAEQGDQVDLPRHGVDLADAVDGGDVAGDLGNSRDVGLDEHDRGDQRSLLVRYG
jgi:hypothetical protein